MHPSSTPLPPVSGFAEAVGTLATLFGAPLGEADVEALRQPAERGALAPLASIAALRPGVERAVAAVRGLGDTQAAVSQLNRAYCLLFLGAGGPMTAPPYESAYQGSGRLFQEPAGEMAALLERRGRRLADDFPEAPDHLVIELALLEESLTLAVATGHAEDAETAALLLARLRRWVPRFAEACGARDGTGFYALAAGLLDRLLQDGVDARPARAPT